MQKQGKDALLQLCNQSPPITDEDTISLLDNALSNLNIRESNSIRLWERAASAKPGDENLLEKWMFRAVAERNWISAQKVCLPSTIPCVWQKIRVGLTVGRFAGGYDAEEELPKRETLRVLGRFHVLSDT